MRLNHGVLLPLLLLAAGGSAWSGERNSVPVGSVAPALKSASWLNAPSTGLSADDLRGRVVLAELFETGCTPCKRTLPHIQSLHERYGGRGLTVVLVCWEKSTVLSPFAREWGLTMPIACDAAGTTAAFLNPGYPTSVLIDKEGKVAFVGTPISIDEPIEAALGLQMEPAEILSAYAAAALKKDAVAQRAALDRLIERAGGEFDLRAWAGAQPAAEAGAESPEGAAPAAVPQEPAKALAEMLRLGTPSPRREAIRASLAESGPTGFDLLAFAREALGRDFPLTLKEVKDWVAAGRLDLLVDGLLDRRPTPAMLDEVAKAKALAPRAAKRAVDARADARKGLILAECVFARSMTADEAPQAPFWSELAVTGWGGGGPEKRLTAVDVRGQLVRPATASAFVDRALSQAVVLDALAGGKKPALATVAASAAKERGTLAADVKAKYPHD